MKRSLDELIDRARAAPVPWSAERFERVEREIVRQRFRARAGWKQLTLGLASAALCASFVLVARAIRPAPPERGSGLAAPLTELSEPTPPSERPLGDGGFLDDAP